MMLEFNEEGWLQPAGLLPIDRVSAKKLTVFNEHRDQLWAQFNELLQRLATEEVVVYDIWLDGSFVSNKQHPEDLDAVLFIDTKVLNSRYLHLDKLRNQFAGLDVHWASINHGDDALSRAITAVEQGKWMDTFGFSRQQRPKGFFQLINQ